MRSGKWLRASLLVLLVGCRSRQPLPELFTLPDTTLLDDRGRTFTLGSLHGSVVIYDFIFTRCGGTCPIMTQRMKALIDDLPRDQRLRLVSISVDPTHDRPDVLQRYASKVRTDPRWIFTTGEKDAIFDLSVNGFKLAAVENGGNTREPILHSTKFVLADQRGVVRGYYDSSAADARQKLVDDVEELLDR